MPRYEVTYYDRNEKRCGTTYVMAETALDAEVAARRLPCRPDKAVSAAAIKWGPQSRSFKAMVASGWIREVAEAERTT